MTWIFLLTCGARSIGDIEEMEAHKDQIVDEKLLNRGFLNAKLGPNGHPWSS
jgi:hypothetical protein